MKKNIAIITGGDSSEMEISLLSAKGIYSFIDDKKYNKYIVTIRHKEWLVEILPGMQVLIDKNDFSFKQGVNKVTFDYAYITIHGTPGENGLLEGYLEMLGIPHSTCPALQSAITFNKFVCNRYVNSFKEILPDLNIAESCFFRSTDSIDKNQIVSQIGFPCFVKPNAGGSSFGVSKVKDISELDKAIKFAFTESSEIVIEKAVKGIEISCGCYVTNKSEVALPPTELAYKGEFFDYDAKYNGNVEEITPARLPEEIIKRVQKLTLDIYKILGCKGFIRIDYIIEDTNIFMIEINTVPGMTPASILPQQIKAAQLNITEVFTEVIENELSKNK